MNNNDIFKKLRVALQLRDDQIIEILALADFRMEKPELNALFRNPDHPNFMECGDQVLRNFLNGLIIHLRGTKDKPKNAMDVINKNREEVKARISSDTSKTSDGQKKFTKKKPASNPKSREKKTAPKVQVVEKVQYKNGKK